MYYCVATKKKLFKFLHDFIKTRGNDHYLEFWAINMRINDTISQVFTNFFKTCQIAAHYLEFWSKSIMNTKGMSLLLRPKRSLFLKVTRITGQNSWKQFCKDMDGTSIDRILQRDKDSAFLEASLSFWLPTGIAVVEGV